MRCADGWLRSAQHRTGAEGVTGLWSAWRGVFGAQVPSCAAIAARYCPRRISRARGIGVPAGCQLIEWHARLGSIVLGGSHTCADLVVAVVICSTVYRCYRVLLL